MTQSTAPLRLLRFGEVRQRTGLSRSTIWRMERSGIFPRRIKVSINVVAWREDEVDKWIASKLQRA
ncbi:MAG: transcriptional regulator [Acidobacteria bacterium]|nr:MAG: transcriptional regulator [Acidobacteriota bacterium]